MNNIDKWAAEQCGVNLSGMVEGMVIGDEKPSEFVTLGSQWTIQDPRCREIVRERFAILTTMRNGNWFAISTMGEAEGDTIAEAEIACITAIFEAEASSEAREARDD